MCLQKFQIDRLSRFPTVARQMFTTQRPFLSETPLTMKTATSNSLWTHFLIKLPSVIFFEIYSCFQQKTKYLNSIWEFPFFNFIFFWNEVSKKSSIKEDKRFKVQEGKFSEAVAQMCSVKKMFLEISQNSLEKPCARVSFLINLQASVPQLYSKWDSGTGVFRYILWSFYEHIFLHNTSIGYFWIVELKIF